jgi:hypothetical protein
MEKLPHRGRQIGHYRCVWLVSGLSDLEWLRKLVDGNYGRYQEVDEGSYRTVLRTSKQSSAALLSSLPDQNTV